MTLDAIELTGATQRLYTYILEQHWNGDAIVGPDPGIRLNARMGRFVKTYLGFIPWSDDLVYLQAQGYSGVRQLAHGRPLGWPRV